MDLILGAVHADELDYLFNRPSTPDIETGSVEDEGWRNMVALWTNFAKYGNPTPEGSTFTWEPFQGDERYYLHIATNGSFSEMNLLQNNMDFWDSIYEDYYPSKGFIIHGNHFWKINIITFLLILKFLL